MTWNVAELIPIAFWQSWSIGIIAQRLIQQKEFRRKVLAFKAWKNQIHGAK